MTGTRAITDRIRSGSWTLGKRAWQRLRPSDGPGPRALFVVGCQRSGTTLLADVLRRSLHTRVYHEAEDSPAFLDCRLRPEETIRGILADSPADLVVFKPICDSQWTDRLLENHPGSKVVWIYRHHGDVANSAVAKWGSHQRDFMAALSRGDTGELAWRGERLSPEVLATLSRFDWSVLSDHDGAALFWWMRNRLYFELGLASDPRVHLLRYESLVTEPEATGRELCRFLDLPWSRRLTSEVHADSVRKRERPELNGRVSEQCEEMLARLEGAWQRRSAPVGG